jgi:alpha-glucoside transport system permease protein
MIKVINGLLAIIGGVGGVLILFWIFNWLVEHLPGKWGGRFRPYVFVGPAVVAIGVFLIYPTIRTIILSFANANSTEWIGLDNYTTLFGEAEFRQTLINNLLWILIVPASCVALGLLVAVLADRLKPTGEKVSKSLIFLPMAISMVGASVIWRFVYEWRPEGQPQIGLLNAIWTGLGGAPQTWLQISNANLNDILLMVIMIWAQVGFSMVLLSAAIKNVPEETVEAARIDGASEVQAFFRVVVPQMWGTVVTVFITVLITVMKVFDIIYVNTGGNFETDVIANRFFREIFEFGNAGTSAAIVVILLVAITPVMIYQVRHYRAEEAMR